MTNIINIIEGIVNFIMATDIYGVVFSCMVIIIESIVPIIPVWVFISSLFMLLGKQLGFLVSWICIILGCIFSYLIFKNGLGNKFENLTRDKEQIKKYTKLLKNISTGKLLLIIACPFLPAFVINIVAGLVKMDFKKYFIALVFGKISLVLYSAFIGLSFVQSINNPISLVYMILIILAVYLGYIVLKKILKLNI